MIEVTAGWYLSLAAVLFSIGLLGILVRRNALIMFMCVELMLNAVNLTFVAAGRALAAAEVVVGLAIIVAIFRSRESASVDELAELRG